MDTATKFKNYLSLIPVMPEMENDITEIFRPRLLFRHHENDQIILAFKDFSFFTIKKGDFPIIFNLQEPTPQNVPKNLRETVFRVLKSEVDNLLTELETGAPQ